MRLLVKLLACVLLPVALLSAGPSFAGEPGKPLLWRLNAGGSTVYLLGSFHMLRPSDYPLSTEIDEAFADAEHIAFEVSPSELADAAAMQKALRHARLGGDARIQNVLPSEVGGRLASMLEQAGLPLSRIDRYQPWFASSRLVLDASLRKGFKLELGLDKHLMARAAAVGKPVSGLESLDDQMRALGAAPIQEQMRTLCALIDAPQSLADGVERLHAAWRSGDAEALDRESRAALQASAPGTYRTINVDRNRAWLPAIQSMLDRPAGEDVLVVVGAMHLLGRDGLVAMLHERGMVAHRVGTSVAPTLAALRSAQ